MSIENKIATCGWGNDADATTRKRSSHGVSKSTRRAKQVINKSARVKAAKQHFKTFEV